MASIERTCYPRLKKRFSSQELSDYYTPTESEIYFVKNHAHGDEPQLHLLVLLKTFQKLAYFPKLDDVPPEIISHLFATLRIICSNISPIRNCGRKSKKKPTKLNPSMGLSNGYISEVME